MKIRVLFFGFAHDVTGFAQEEAEVPEGVRLDDLWKEYQNRFPRLAEMADSLLIAVNEVIAKPSRTLQEGDEVALVPRLKEPHDGAVVVFEGIVRNHSQGRKTIYLEYEAYEPMAIRMMEEIGREAKQTFAIDHIGMIHRIGRIEIGEASVAIIVTSAHRRAAFEACHYAIDELKRRVPIWKKEYFEDG